jgi:hypothetical protein
VAEVKVQRYLAGLIRPRQDSFGLQNYGFDLARDGTQQLAKGIGCADSFHESHGQISYVIGGG